MPFYRRAIRDLEPTQRREALGNRGKTVTGNVHHVEITNLPRAPFVACANPLDRPMTNLRQVGTVVTKPTDCSLTLIPSSGAMGIGNVQVVVLIVSPLNQVASSAARREKAAAHLYRIIGKLTVSQSTKIERVKVRNMGTVVVTTAMTEATTTGLAMTTGMIATNRTIGAIENETTVVLVGTREITSEELTDMGIRKRTIMIPDIKPRISMTLDIQEGISMIPGMRIVITMGTPMTDTRTLIIDGQLRIWLPSEISLERATRVTVIHNMLTQRSSQYGESSHEVNRFLFFSLSLRERLKIISGFKRMSYFVLFSFYKFKTKVIRSLESKSK